LIKTKIRENPYLLFFEIIEKTKPIIFTKFKKKYTRKKQKITIIPIYLRFSGRYKKAIK